MSEPKWVETKKEYDITDTGERVPKKVTLEPFKKKYADFEKKEAIDIGYKSVKPSGYLYSFVVILSATKS